MKNFMKKLGNVFSWIFNISMIGLLIIACFTMFKSYQTGEPANIFGYRPMFILTGSMEPEMREHSLAVTKNLDAEDIAGLEKGDVITYHVWDENSDEVNGEPRKVVITHRIYNIKEENGETRYITKGDNNRTADAYYLTAENIVAEVVWTWNGFADVYAKWNSGMSGKLLILSPVAIFILLYIAIKSFFGGNNEDDNKEKTKKNKEAETVDKIKCENCGEYFDATMDFCGHCGTKKPEPKVAGKIKCEACGNEFDENMAFCGHCGAKKPEPKTPVVEAEVSEEPKAIEDEASKAEFKMPIFYDSNNE